MNRRIHIKVVPGAATDEVVGPYGDGLKVRVSAAPEEAAAELIEEEIQPFVDQAKRYHDLGMLDQEREYCAGIILGLYRYEKESKTEFRNWSEDLPLDSAGWLRGDWRERNTAKSTRNMMDAFIRERCPDWARMLTREDRWE